MKGERERGGGVGGVRRRGWVPSWHPWPHGVTWATWVLVYTVRPRPFGEIPDGYPPKPEMSWMMWDGALWNRNMQFVCPRVTITESLNHIVCLGVFICYIQSRLMDPVSLEPTFGLPKPEELKRKNPWPDQQGLSVDWSIRGGTNKV